jgi:predicted SAM-dependent methyltransferase
MLSKKETEANMKLHLGCGQRYLEGYVNIDFPLSEHTVQVKSVADQHANILELKYPAGSIEEVRLHHVFEHFFRPVASGLLTSWFSWMPAGGQLHIEVPDFSAAAKRMLGRFRSRSERCVAERHAFGSQEAAWAVHCAGYTEGNLRWMLELFGFEPTRVARNVWKYTDNLEIFAKRQAQPIPFEEFEKRAEAYQKEFLVDETEAPLLVVWMDAWREQAKKGWAL